MVSVGRMGLLALAGILILPGRPQAEGAMRTAKGNNTLRLYVATNGNDSWSGRRPAPNASRTDGPFATIARAQRAAREAGIPAVVAIRGGTYYLSEPLVFTPEDSDDTYTSYGRERPVISGGVRLTGWRRAADGRWEIEIPQVRSGEWSFVQLFVNGQRRYRPRLPKNGYYFIEDAVPPSPKAEGHGFDRFRFRAGNISANWHNLQDVEVLCFQVWTMARMRVASVDEAEHIVTFAGNTRGTASYSSLPKGNRYIVENVREALSAPGEWYLDQKSGVLTYIPMRGESPQRAVVVAPRLEHLVLIQGDVPGRRWVRNLTLRGLSFQHANWSTPPEGNAYPQAEVNLDGVVKAEGARGCVLQNCEVSHVGTYAIEWGAGCRENRVEGCTLTDLGAGGVKIGLTSIPSDEEAVASHNVVRNCTIAHCGRLHPAAVGVWIGHSPYNTVEHNEIADLYYTGVSVGWSWGYGPSLAHHNTIAYNHIHTIGQGVLSDMGGIYTLGLSPGTELHHNLIHDVNSFDYGGWGIYPDEGTTDMLIDNNVVYRAKSAGFHQHYGRNNTVHNNVFAFGQQAQIMRTRAEEHLSFTFDHNIVYFNEGVLLGSNWSGSNYQLDYNVYWDASGRPITFAGVTFEEWQKKGQDVHSLIADPLFVDPSHGDFRLKPGSPALGLGIKPIDVSTAGPILPPGKPRAVSTAPRAFPPPPPHA